MMLILNVLKQALTITLFVFAMMLILDYANILSNGRINNIIKGRRWRQYEDTFLVIDEAYFEFSGVTFADLVSDHPNLAITRTMDKAFSLAGARIGYLLAGNYFLDVFSSFYTFLPQSSLHAAVEALNCTEYVRKNVKLIVDERKRLQKKIEDLGTSVSSSSTNFLLIKTEIPDLSVRLKNSGVLVSDVSSQLAPGSIRISVGTREENDAFINGYSKILEEAYE